MKENESTTGMKNNGGVILRGREGGRKRIRAFVGWVDGSLSN